MKEYYGNLENDGKNYLLAFSFNVMESIQEKYGSVEKWGQLCGGGDGVEPNIKALKFGFTEMINEGIDILNEKNGEHNPPMTSRQVGRLLSDVGFDNAATALKDVVSDSTNTGADEKNA